MALGTSTAQKAVFIVLGAADPAVLFASRVRGGAVIELTAAPLASLTCARLLKPFCLQMYCA